MPGNDKSFGELRAARPSSGDLIDAVLENNLRARLFGEASVTTLGRLHLERPLGRGAMGAVLSAYDPVLGRHVAVKTLRADSGNDRDALLREARVLAKLDHPNVVAIHDVVEDSGELHLVMEQVDGCTLREEMRRGLTWQEAIALLRQAGAGLAAAHALGVVHSDIKPENILVSGERVRLIDFGLAQSTSESGQHGGTPGYLAPERVAGAGGSAAADQYAFFVTLVEAIEGRRPDETQALSKMPLWLVAVVHRGLATAPAERFGGMDEALRALAPAERSTTWWQKRHVLVVAVCALLLLAALGVLGVLAVGSATRVSPACDPDIFDSAAIERDRIARTAVGDVAGEGALRIIDAYGAEWNRTGRALCLATHEEGTQSEQMLDVRMRCLNLKAQRLGALFVEREPTLASEWHEISEAVAELEPARECFAVGERAGLALPREPALRQRIESAEQQLARSWADFSMGRYRKAQSEIEKLARETADLSDPGFVARRDLQHATIVSRAGDAALAAPLFDHALAMAARIEASSLEAQIWLGRLRHELLTGEPETMLEWLPFAEAAMARADLGHGELDLLAGEALRHLGRHAEARERLSRFIDPAQRAKVPPLRQAIWAMNLGSVLLSLDEPAAHQVLEEGLQLARAALGSDQHPGLALYLDKLAQAKLADGRPREALTLWDEALALRERGYGAADRATASTLLHSAAGLVQVGRLDEAEVRLQRAAAIREDVYGKDHPRRVEIALALAELALARLQVARARELIDDVHLVSESAVRVRIDARRLEIARGTADLERLRLQLAEVPPSELPAALDLGRLDLETQRVLALVALDRKDDARALAERLASACAGTQRGLRTHIFLASAFAAVGEFTRAHEHLGAARARVHESGPLFGELEALKNRLPPP